MARKELNREDLMQDATALVRRVELQIRGQPDTVVAGFRGEGSISIYLGPEIAYHFDDRRCLRRAYVDGAIYRTQGTTLARLNRVRTHDSTELRRHDLAPAERDAFISSMRGRLARLSESISRGEAVVRRQIPGDGDIAAELVVCLNAILAVDVRLASPIKGKR